MDKRVEMVKTSVSESQMAQAIIAVWKGMFGNTPSKEQVSMILAQNNLETGNRANMYNYNVGNITHTQGDGFDYWQSKDWHYNAQHDKVYYTAKFRAYPNLETGVKDYFKLLNNKRYAGAFQHIIHPDPTAFSKALKAGGYYGADEKTYTAGIQAQFNKVNKSNGYEVAMSGKIPASPSANVVAPIASSAPNNTNNQEMAILDDILSMLPKAANVSLKKLYKQALPNHDILIKISAPEYTDAIEFSRILCTALDEDLLATTYPYTDGHLVEVECKIAGPHRECFAAVKQMTEVIAETFKEATIKIGGITITTDCIMDKKSYYQPISLRTADTNYRKFLLKFI
ncbi:MAG TPA: glucosaminidase domain-containing protein [Candidatus Saccharimonadales bacterium]